MNHMAKNKLVHAADIAADLEILAPLEWAEPWDNVGLLLGDSGQTVERVFLCLDVDQRALEAALEYRADLIVCHHPLIFNGLKSLCEDRPESRVISTLIRNNISAYAAHTNLDAAVGGVNDALAEMLGLNVLRTLFPIARRDDVGGGNLEESSSGKNLPIQTIQPGFVRFCELVEPLLFRVFLKYLQTALSVSGCFVSGTSNRLIRTVAVTGGAYEESWTEKIAAAGTDCLISGEIKHHQLLALEARGVRAVAAGHDCTERVVLPALYRRLREHFPGLALQIDEGLDYTVLSE